MSTDLFKVIDVNGRMAVSARDLHTFLEVKKHFTQWFEDQKDWFQKTLTMKRLT